MQVIPFESEEIKKEYSHDVKGQGINKNEKKRKQLDKSQSSSIVDKPKSNIQSSFLNSINFTNQINSIFVPPAISNGLKKKKKSQQILKSTKLIEDKQAINRNKKVLMKSIYKSKVKKTTGLSLSEAYNLLQQQGNYELQNYQADFNKLHRSQLSLTDVSEQVLKAKKKQLNGQNSLSINQNFHIIYNMTTSLLNNGSIKQEEENNQIHLETIRGKLKELERVQENLLKSYEVPESKLEKIEQNMKDIKPDILRGIVDEAMKIFPKSKTLKIYNYHQSPSEVNDFLKKKRKIIGLEGELKIAVQLVLDLNQGESEKEVLTKYLEKFGMQHPEQMIIETNLQNQAQQAQMISQEKLRLVNDFLQNDNHFQGKKEQLQCAPEFKVPLNKVYSNQAVQQQKLNNSHQQQPTHNPQNQQPYNFFQQPQESPKTSADTSCNAPSNQLKSTKQSTPKKLNVPPELADNSFNVFNQPVFQTNSLIDIFTKLSKQISGPIQNSKTLLQTTGTYNPNEFNSELAAAAAAAVQNLRVNSSLTQKEQVPQTPPQYLSKHNSQPSKQPQNISKSQQLNSNQIKPCQHPQQVLNQQLPYQQLQQQQLQQLQQQAQQQQESPHFLNNLIFQNQQLKQQLQNNSLPKLKSSPSLPTQTQLQQQLSLQIQAVKALLSIQINQQQQQQQDQQLQLLQAQIQKSQPQAINFNENENEKIGIKHGNQTPNKQAVSLFNFTSPKLKSENTPNSQQNILLSASKTGFQRTSHSPGNLRKSSSQIEPTVNSEIPNLLISKSISQSDDNQFLKRNPNLTPNGIISPAFPNKVEVSKKVSYNKDDKFESPVSTKKQSEIEEKDSNIKDKPSSFKETNSTPKEKINSCLQQIKSMNSQDHLPFNNNNNNNKSISLQKDSIKSLEQLFFQNMQNKTKIPPKNTHQAQTNSMIHEIEPLTSFLTPTQGNKEQVNGNLKCESKNSDSFKSDQQLQAIFQQKNPKEEKSKLTSRFSFEERQLERTTINKNSSSFVQQTDSQFHQLINQQSDLRLSLGDNTQMMACGKEYLDFGKESPQLFQNMQLETEEED